MTSTTTDLQHVVGRLSAPGLIRLISEIDDHGPIPRRGFTRSFPDLARHQIRHAVKEARDLALIHSTGEHHLTEAGEALAELYDAAARWGRQHQYPAKEGHFTLRVSSALALLVRPEESACLPSTTRPEAAADASTAPGLEELEAVRSALLQWLNDHSRAPLRTAYETAA
ncbi:hypothetical protein [Streptomyces sp. NPDC026589]|uniref:hypothetical protein n=1 Tax=Streptomyces TaxID=1883 RepID=UPI0034012EAA|nr:hypothetical protein OHB50_31085 [Streptomyces anulatus]